MDLKIIRVIQQKKHVDALNKYGLIEGYRKNVWSSKRLY